MKWPKTRSILLTVCVALPGCAEEDEKPAPSVTGSGSATASQTTAGSATESTDTQSDPSDAGSSESGDPPNTPGVAPTCADGELRFVGTVDGAPVNGAPTITSQNFDGVGSRSLRIEFDGGSFRLDWEQTMEGPVDVTGHLEGPGVEGRLCAGDGSFLDLDPMESLPFELRGLTVSATGDCADAAPASGEILGCWGAGF